MMDFINYFIKHRDWLLENWRQCLSLVLFTITITYIIINLFIIQNQIAETEKLRYENIQLSEQLTPFRTVALQFFPGPEAEALSNLARRIANLELDLMNIHNIQEYAQWSFNGKVHNDFSDSFKVTSLGSIAGWSSEKIWNLPDGTLHIKCEQSDIQYYKNLTYEYAAYPFPYYAVYKCLKEIGDSSANTYKEKAIQILENTTSVPNHHIHHDQVLEELQS